MDGSSTYAMLLRGGSASVSMRDLFALVHAQSEWKSCLWPCRLYLLYHQILMRTLNLSSTTSSLSSGSFQKPFDSKELLMSLLSSSGSTSSTYALHAIVSYLLVIKTKSDDHEVLSRSIRIL